MSEDEYHRLLKQFPDKMKGVLNWKIYFQRLVGAGRKTGRTDIQIGDDIRKELKGEIPDITIRKYLPESMKHQEFTNKEAIKSIAYGKQPTSKDKVIEVKPEEMSIEEKKFLITTVPKAQVKEVKADEESGEFGISPSPTIKADPPFTEAEREKVHEIMSKPDTVRLFRNKMDLASKIALGSRSNLELTINGNEVVKIKEI